MSLINQIAASKVGEKTSKYLFSSNDGVKARKRAGIIFMISGVCWILIMLGANWMASSTPEPNPMPTKMLILMLSIGVISMLCGAIQLILLKKSSKFREWANKDYDKDILKIAEMEKSPLKQLKVVIITLVALSAFVAILYLILVI